MADGKTLLPSLSDGRSQCVCGWHVQRTKKGEDQAHNKSLERCWETKINSNTRVWIGGMELNFESSLRCEKWTSSRDLFEGDDEESES
ncbi:unnamed protein product [Camellia sinensis]